MFVISRHQGWCLRNRTSTQTTTATSASTYSTMAARLPIVPFYRVTDLLASPTTSHHSALEFRTKRTAKGPKLMGRCRSRATSATFYQFRGDKQDKSGEEVVITDRKLARAA